MKRKTKRRLLKLTKQQLRDPYLSPKVQRAFEGLRGELASLNKRITALESLTYGMVSYSGNITPIKRKSKSA